MISGTPTAVGSFAVTVGARDAFAQVINVAVTIVIAALPALVFTAPPAGQVGVPYTTLLAVSGGLPSITWSVTGGTLPPGLTLNAQTGVLSGTPTTAASTTFTVGVVDANLKTASRVVTIVIGVGPLVIVKSASASSAVLGGTVNYTITITNNGSTAFTAVNLSDPLATVLDDATLVGTPNATTGTLGTISPTLTWSGDIGPNGVVTITYSVTIKNPDVGNRVLTNTVTSSTLGTNCPTGTIDSRCTATVTVSGLTILKTADVATTTPGSVVHFTITVTNSGQTVYTGATLTDTLAGVLDDAVYNSDAGTTSGNVSYTNPVLTWTGNLAVGAIASITYSVTVANPDTGNRTLTGTVVSPAAGSSCPGGNPAPSCSATVLVLVPALSIVTTASVSSTTPDSLVTYTVTVTNAGETPYPEAGVTLDLAGVLDDAAFGSTSATGGTAIFDAPNGAVGWTGPPTLATGASISFTASVTVNNPDTGNRTMTAVASSSAAGSTCPAGSANSLCTRSVQVLIPALTITKAADVSSTTPGSVVNYTVTVTNNGQTAYAAATFTDGLAEAILVATGPTSINATLGTATFTSPSLTWTGTLGVGETATITYTMTLKPSTTRGASLGGTITSTTPGNNCTAGSSDTRCASAVPILIPALGFGITSDAGATTTPGSVVRYTLTVSNTGQAAYTGIAVTLNVDEVINDAPYNFDATTSTGSLQPNPDGTVDWVLNLAPGTSASGILSFTVNNPVTGNKNLRLIAISNAAGSECPSAAPGPNCVSSIGVLVPGLLITKTADVTTSTPGGTIVYTVVVENTGETSYPAAAFTDTLTNVLKDAAYIVDSASASTGTVTYTAPTMSWVGSLAKSATAIIHYSVKVLDPYPGDTEILNTVVSTSAGNNCPSGGLDPKCTARVGVLVPGLTIAKTASAPTTVPGATVGYTILVTNTGQTPYTGAAFTDSLAGVIDDATVNVGSVTAIGGTATFTSPNLTWIGNLAVGGTATITYSVTVNTADVGSDILTGIVTSTTAGSNCASGSSDSRCTSSVPVARLVLSRSFDVLTTIPGSVIRLTGTFTNAGKVPYTGVSVTSPVGLNVTDDAIPNGDQTTSSGSLAITPGGLVWTGDIPVGGAVTNTGTLTVRNPDPGDKSIFGTIVSALPGNNCQSGSLDSRCTALVTVLIPGLTVTKVASVTSIVPGGVVGYTMTVHNTGGTPYVGARVTDSLVGIVDDAVVSGATTTGGVVSYVAPVVTWTGDLLVGGSVTISYSVTVRDPDPGDKTMINTVVSSEVGSTCPPATGSIACRSTVLVLTPALTIVNAADRTTTTLGSVVQYTVTVTNTGQIPYAGATFTDDLAGVLDDATYITDDVAASTGTATVVGDVLSWTGALATAPGVASATVTFSVTVKNPSTGNLALTHTVSSGSTANNCGDGSTDTRCTSTVAVAIADTVGLVITKTASVSSSVAGGTVGYTVAVHNATTGTITGAVFDDVLTDVVDDATYDGVSVASVGAATYTVGTKTLSWVGDIPAGVTATVTYSVLVIGAGTHSLSDTVISTTLPGNNTCGVDSTDTRCTTTIPIAALLIMQAYDTTVTTPGSVLTLTATFTNTGQVPYTGITIFSLSAGTIDDAVPTGDQTATSGVLTLSPTAISWTGDIPVGVTGIVTVTGTVTVNNPDTGNKAVTGTLESTAVGNNCPPAGTDTRCTALSTVQIPALTITKTADKTSVVPGGTVNYTINIHNTGQTTYTGAVVTDALAIALDHSTYSGGATATNGTMSYSSSTLTWTGNLNPTETAVVTYSLVAKDPPTGDKTIINFVTSEAAGSSCPPANGNGACRASVAVLTPTLTITSATTVATTIPGAVVGYTVAATNTGQISYSAAVVTIPISQVFAEATYNNDATATATPTGLAYSGLPGGVLTWTGPLALLATVTISFSVTVADPVAEADDYLMGLTVVSAEAGSNCPSGGTDSRCSTAVPIASMHIVDAVNVTTTQPGGLVLYSGSFKNTGKVPYFGATIDMNFGDAMDDALYNGDAQTSTGILTLLYVERIARWVGDIPIGATVGFSFSATVSDPDLVLNGPGATNNLLRTIVSTTAVASNCPPVATFADAAADCKNSVPVLIPGLAISQVASRATATPGDTIGYTVTIANTGDTDYLAIDVTDNLTGVLGDATYNGNAVAKLGTVTSGTVTFASPTLTWTGDLLFGQIIVMTFTVTVPNPDLGDKVIVNRTTSNASRSSCPTGSIAASCASTLFVLIPALDIAIAANTTTTTPGSIVGYTITVDNVGQTAYLGAAVVVDLAGLVDDGTYGETADASIGDFTLDGSILTWTGDVAAGDTVIITYSVTVKNPDTGNHLLNTEVSSAAPGATCTAATRCLNVVTVLTPGLSVITTAAPTTTTPGGQVTFIITVQNTGQTVYTGTVVSASLAGMLDEATLAGVITASSGVVSNVAPEMTWTGSLAPTAIATITVAVIVTDPIPVTGNKSLAMTAIALAAGSSCPATGAAATCTATVAVLIPSLTIGKSASSATTTPGGVVTYTITLHNSGETAYTGAVVTDSLAGILPDAVYNNNAAIAASGPGTLGYAESTLTWTGDLPVGASVTFSYSITVRSPDPGDKAMINSVSSSVPGSSCPPPGTASGCSTLVRVLLPGLVLTKTANVVSVIAGSAVQYTVSATNTGETDYLPAIVTDSLAGVLDDASYVSGTATVSTGSVSLEGNVLVWTAALPKGGATQTMVYSVTTTFPAPGDRSLQNTVVEESQGSNCPHGSTDQRCSSTVPVLVPALTVSKSVDTTTIVAGGIVHYTLLAINTGQAAYAPASFTDSLAGLLDDADYRSDAAATSGTVSVVANVVTWTGPLAVGQSVTVTFSVVVHIVDVGDLLLLNRVVSESLGSTCGATSIAPCITSTAVQARSITLSGLTPSFTLSGPSSLVVTANGAVTMNVQTNSPGGYVVTVQPALGTLVGTGANPETIPVGQLKVRESGKTLFGSLVANQALTVHSQSGPSSASGDAVSSDYQMQIPFVRPDQYSVTLDYIVTTQ